MEMRFIGLSMLLFILFFRLSNAEIYCPYHPPEEGDPYDVVGRHEKLKAAFGGNGATAKKVEKEHNRNGKLDKYVYDISLCGNGFLKQTNLESKAVTNIGRFNESLMFGGEDWLTYTFGGGQAYNSFCNKAKRRTMLTVICEESNKASVMQVVEEARIKNEDKHLTVPFCYYLFQYNHPAACSPKPKSLSAGSIICILLVSLLVVYLAFGMLYKRLVSQAKGFEQIPNYSFWVQLGNLSADGCDLIFRRTRQPANSYKGMADALNIDSSDDEKDDTLLPM